MMESTTAKILAISAGLFLTFFSASVLSATSVYGLSRVSPYPADMVAGSSAADTVGDGNISHMLKKETTALVDTIKIGAYYPASSRTANGKKIKITAGTQGRACLIAEYSTARSPRVRLTGNVIITVTIDGGRRTTYTVNIQDICGTNKLYGHEISFPNGNLFLDSNSGRYRADIEIRYSDATVKGASNENSFNFRVSLEGTGRNTGILAAKKSTAANEFGLRSAWFNRANQAANHKVRAAVAFGFPCGIDLSRLQHRTLRLYDADAVFGDTFLFIEKDNRRLEKDDYDITAMNGVANNRGKYAGSGSWNNAWDSSRKAWKLADSNNSSQMIAMKTGAASSNSEYKLVVLNTGANRTFSPHSNVLSMAIPHDAINSIKKCNYSLTPAITVPSTTYTEGVGDNLDVTGTISQDTTNPSGNHQWQMYVVRYSKARGEYDMPDTRANTVDPCTNIVPQTDRVTDPGACQRLAIMSYPTTYTQEIPYLIPADTSDTFCFFTRVLNPTHATNDDTMYRYSDMVCVNPGKKPKVHIFGHDLRVGDTINTSVTGSSSEIYRSWGEYGVFSNDCNVLGNMSSGSFGRDGDSDGIVSSSSNHPLSFANILSVKADGDPCVIGNYGGPIADFDGYREAEVQNNGSGTVIISANTYDPGTKSVLYYPNATVRITGNLRYPGTYTSIGQIPRVIIIAKNIVIDDGVQRIDPWLIAVGTSAGEGQIATCVEGINRDTTTDAMSLKSISKTDCDEPITFNGPVMANKIYLPRTYGSGRGQFEDAAETFNLRPDAFLSTYAGSNGHPVATTDDIDELPPRF